MSTYHEMSERADNYLTECLSVSRLLPVPAGPELRIKTRGEEL